jgi:hypothetical protein
MKEKKQQTKSNIGHREILFGVEISLPTGSKSASLSEHSDKEKSRPLVAESSLIECSSIEM